MKLVFICSSLEPGRDGVGDYTRRLAAELIRQGQEVRILALNDKRDHRTTDNGLKGQSQWSVVSGQWSGLAEWQESEGTRVECLRLPSLLSWNERVKLARAWVEAFNPDWVSLQFVPFGFHPKGLPFGLAKHLKDIIGSRPLHWMFHELWVLWSFPLSIKNRILGQLQKYWLGGALRDLRPRAVATQLPLYQAELQKIGVVARLIPLHGNIPVSSTRGIARSWLAAQGPDIDVSNRIIFGFFGNILSTLNFELFADCLKKISVSEKPLMVYSAGKLGGAGEKIWLALVEQFQHKAQFIRIGSLDEVESSLYLSALDYGLTSYSPELMGKSGVVAAMWEHDLKVIACGFLRQTEGTLLNRKQLVVLTKSWTTSDTAASYMCHFCNI